MHYPGRFVRLFPPSVPSQGGAGTSHGEFPKCPLAGANVCTLCTLLPITSPCPLPAPCSPGIEFLIEILQIL